MTRIDWDLLTRYRAGSCTAAERQWLERLASADPDLALVLTTVAQVAADGDASVDDATVARHLAAIKRRPRVTGADTEALVEGPVRSASTAPGTPDTTGVATTETLPRRKLPRPRLTLRGARPWWQGLAAGALLTGGAVAGWLASRPPPAPPAVEPHSIVQTAPGQRLGLRFSDGTLVMLAPGTTLRTPADYGRHERALELDGEAVFTVVHDSARPFSVRTNGLIARDLGTRFLVRAYRGDQVADVVVAEGEVAVTPTATAGSQSDSLIVRTRERVQVAASGRVNLVSSVNLDGYFGWVDGRLVFRDTPLREVARRLSRWFDVEIRLDPDSLGRRRIRAVVQDEPAADVLRTIAASLDLELVRAGRLFTLTTH